MGWFGGGQGSSRNTTRISQPASAQRKTTVTREEFENLATLVLELKEEVRALRSPSH